MKIFEILKNLFTPKTFEKPKNQTPTPPSLNEEEEIAAMEVVDEDEEFFI